MRGQNSGTESYMDQAANEVNNLLEQNALLKSRAEKAEAACAEMRLLVDKYVGHHPLCVVGKFEENYERFQCEKCHAFSSYCGKGWMSPEQRDDLESALELERKHSRKTDEKVRVLVEALEKISRETKAYPDPYVYIARQALAQVAEGKGSQ